MEFFKSYLGKILKQGTANANEKDSVPIRLLDPKEFDEHKTKTVKAFKAVFAVEDAAPAAEKLKRIDNWPTIIISGGLGLQYWENQEVKEWRVYYKDCNECAKPIYGKWHVSPLELAKNVVQFPAPECSSCKPLCPLRPGDAYCPQKRGKYGCQWWLVDERMCVVEKIGLK